MNKKIEEKLNYLATYRRPSSSVAEYTNIPTLIDATVALLFEVSTGILKLKHPTKQIKEELNTFVTILENSVLVEVLDKKAGLNNVTIKKLDSESFAKVATLNALVQRQLRFEKVVWKNSKLFDLQN